MYNINLTRFVLSRDHKIPTATNIYTLKFDRVSELKISIDLYFSSLEGTGGRRGGLCVSRNNEKKKGKTTDGSS